MRSLRILFAMHGPPDPATAVYTTVLERAAFLRRRGHNVEVVTPVDLGVARWPRVQPLLVPASLAVRDLAAYDAVVFHSYTAWAYLMRTALWGEGRRRPVGIVAFHGLEPLYHEAVAAELARTGDALSWRFTLLHRMVLPRLLRHACRRADAVFCLNSAERAFLASAGWTDPERIAVLPNGVERDLFIDGRSYAARATRLLFVGQWLRAKGVRHLANAFCTLLAAHPDLELTCAGTLAAPDEVLAMFASDAHPRIRVIPRLSREELRAELRRAELFVFPSVYEGYGKALIEAMASGLPVVTTPVGAAVDLLDERRAAVMVPIGDGEALARACARLLDDQPQRAGLGHRARDLAERCEWDGVNAAYAAALEGAVADRRGGNGVAR